MSGMMMAMMSGDSGVYTSIAGSASTSLIGGGSCSVTLTVRQAGTWQLTNVSGTPSLSPSGSQSWVTPNNAGSGNTRWVRMTVNSGTTPAGLAAGTWTSLATDQTATLSAGPATTVDSNITISIATDSGGSNIVSTGVVVLHADND